MLQTHAFDEIIDFIAGYEPERVINFHPSEKTQERVEWLLEKKKEDLLSLEEKSELDYFLILEHIIRLAKARALQSMHQ